MSFLIHCSALAALLVSSLCIRAPAAASASAPPPSSLSSAAISPPPADACPSRCPSLPTLSPNVTFLNHTSTSSVFFLSTNLSSSSPFTINFTDAEFAVDGSCPPTLAFTLFPFIMEPITFDFPDIRREHFTTAEQSSLLALCKSRVTRISLNPTSSSGPGPAGPHPWDSEETHFNDAVSVSVSLSLTYNADSAEVHVQAVVSHGGGFEINQTFNILNTTDLQPVADSISLFVGYFTTRETSITITIPPPPHENNSNSKSKHNIKIVLWAIVGVSTVAFLVGLIILALFVKKHHRRPASLVSSHSAGHVLPPSTTTKPPFPRRHLESSATPMMMALPPSPPYHTNDFQISSTASWLKQPNPR